MAKCKSKHQIEVNCYNFAEALKSLRTYSDLTIEQISMQSDLSVPIITSLEKGTMVPTSDMIAKLSQAMKIPLYFGKHRQVKVQVGSMVASIDEGIAPLIRELWIAGIDTVMSCQQSSHGCIWIEFYSESNVIQFLNIVAHYEDDGLYWRIYPRHEITGSLPAWEYSVSVEDYSLNMVNENNIIDWIFEPPSNFHLYFSVRFPPQDLPAVLARMNEHNQQMKKVGPDGAWDFDGILNQMEFFADFLFNRAEKVLENGVLSLDAQFGELTTADFTQKRATLVEGIATKLHKLAQRGNRLGEKVSRIHQIFLGELVNNANLEKGIQGNAAQEE